MPSENEKWGSHPFKEIDNFLDLDDFNSCVDFLEGLQQKSRANKIISTRKAGMKNSNRDYDQDFLTKLEQKYTEKCKNILAELEPSKTHLQVTLNCSPSITPAGVCYPIHNDSLVKVLSGIVYLAPKKSLGTFIHSNQNDKNPSQIQWKQNKAFFFSRFFNKTWHSYCASESADRYTLVINLVTENKRLHLVEEIGIVLASLSLTYDYLKLIPYKIKVKSKRLISRVYDVIRIREQ